jgi:hypothetical protein
MEPQMTDATDKHLADVTLDELKTAIAEAMSYALVRVMVATGYAIIEGEMPDHGQPRHLDG